tara:strand:+ start:111 stop:938 length:828 start_codon:yes stop_codon:yes gene_type:complete
MSHLLDLPVDILSMIAFYIMNRTRSVEYLRFLLACTATAAVRHFRADFHNDFRHGIDAVHAFLQRRMWSIWFLRGRQCIWGGDLYNVQPWHSDDWDILFKLAFDIRTDFDVCSLWVQKQAPSESCIPAMIHGFRHGFPLSSLTSISFVYASVGNGELSRLLSMTTSLLLPVLEVLHIRGEDFDAETLVVLRKAVERLPRLKRLLLPDNDITDETVSLLYPTKPLQSLELIDLCINPVVTDATGALPFDAVRDKVPNAEVVGSFRSLSDPFHSVYP